MNKPVEQPAQVPPQVLDGIMNAAFTAFTADLGRPFVAGARNVRAVVQQWCPLKKDDYDSLTATEFFSSYGPAHFFDRWIFADELKHAKALELASFVKFQENVERGEKFNEEVRRLTRDPEHRDSWLCSVLGEAALLCQKVLGPLDVDQIFASCRHGPNSTVGVPLMMSYPDVKAKTFDGPEAVQELFLVDYLRWDTTLRPMLDDRWKCWENGTLDAVVKDLRTGIRPDFKYRGARLSFVPKKFDKLRTMMPGSTLGQFFQLGTGDVIAERLRNMANIDLTNQADCHRLLAKFASRHPDVLDTIDWSEASDRLWISLCDAVLPRDWLEWLKTIRDEVAVYKGKTLTLPMIGTMGNGFTFPLQTLLFWSILSGIARTDGHDELVISSYGDDGIIPHGMFPSVERFASLVGWKINADKSFTSGCFRESCGMDAIHGEGVRPCQPARPDVVSGLVSVQAFVHVVYNGLLESIQGRCATPNLDRWVEQVHSELSLGKIHVVPPFYGDNAGIKVKNPLLPDRDPCLYRVPLLRSHRLPEVPGINKHLDWEFDALIEKPPKRKVRWCAPYYWLGLIRGARRGDRAFDRCLHDGTSGGHPLDEENTPSQIDRFGEVAVKITMLHTKRQRAITWSCWDDPGYVVK